MRVPTPDTRPELRCRVINASFRTVPISFCARCRRARLSILNRRATTEREKCAERVPYKFSRVYFFYGKFVSIALKIPSPKLKHRIHARYSVTRVSLVFFFRSFFGGSKSSELKNEGLTRSRLGVITRKKWRRARLSRRRITHRSFATLRRARAHAAAPALESFALSTARPSSFAPRALAPSLSPHVVALRARLARILHPAGTIESR